MGGGVVLMLAGERKDIRSVVALSPFVGWSTWGQWAKRHPNNARAVTLWGMAMNSYGSSNPRAAVYQQRSPVISRIMAPVLLLQGTADQEVVWQTVRSFYQQMRAAKKPARFVLIPGGHHGLHGIHQTQATQAVQSFYRWVATQGHQPS